MGAIKNVAVVGASGNLGRPVVQELLNAGFQVTALARASSTATFPDGVTVKTVDFASSDSLKAVFAGQDAVVSTIATLAIGAQIDVIDAAHAAGVKRFIPSEFGVNTRHLQIAGLKAILGAKIKAVDYLQETAAKDPSFSWTGIANGLFFDWGLAVGSLGLDAKNKTTSIVDSGDERFPASNLPFIGRAVAAVLQHPDETANKYINVASFNLSRNQLIAIVEELTGAKWTVARVSSADLLKIADEKLAKGDFSAFREYLSTHLYGDGSGNGLTAETSANALLGLAEEDPKETVRQWLVATGAI